MSHKPYRYTVPIPMTVGPGTIAELPKELEARGIRNPLLVTDPGLVKAGLAERAGIDDVFSEVDGNPTEENVRAAAKAFEGHDGIVALGGGSAIDCAKGLRLTTGNDGPLSDYGFLNGGLTKIAGPLVPMIAIPTTAGTGSEVARGALIIADGRKIFVASPYLVPTAAILDPELLTGQPQWLIAGCGMDALCHCIEELASPRVHPVAEALATRAMSMIEANLLAAFDDPSNVDAHEQLQLAAMMAGASFEKGLGAVHSLSHAIGAMRPVHHGTLNAVLLPAVMRFNGSDPHMVEAFNDRLGIAPSLEKLGVPDEDKVQAAELAMADHCHLTNPRKCSSDDFIQLWEESR